MLDYDLLVMLDYLFIFSDYIKLTIFQSLSPSFSIAIPHSLSLSFFFSLMMSTGTVIL